MSLALAGYFPDLPRPRIIVPPVVEPEPPPPAEWAAKLIRSVCAEIAEAHGITVTSLLSPLRYAHIVRARDHALAVIRWSSGLSYPELGRIFGCRDHTTVHAAVRRHEHVLNGEKRRKR